MKTTHAKRKNNSSQTRRGGSGIFIAIIFIIFVILILNFLPFKFGEKETQTFTVERGASLRQVANLLQSQKIIRNKLAFEVYVRLDYKSRMVKAGSYEISSGMSIPRIARELHRGIAPQFRVTIPEGLTVRELCDLLTEKGLVDPMRFMALINDLTFINSILGDFAVNGSPEGYLFPDTYDLASPTSEEKIIETMLLRFKEVYLQNFPDIPAAQRKNMVILASIVEKEAKKDAERPVIASVFYNLLRKGDLLRSCATVEYALGVHKKKLYEKDLQVDSPYNTYLHYGLPPGPIANPGLASLKAAAFPAETRYLFFVAKPDGTHVFSNTYEEHLRAKRKISRDSYQ